MEYAAEMQKCSRLAKMSEVTADDLLVHLTIKGAESELVPRLLKLTNPCMRDLTDEARSFYTAQAAEAALGKNVVHVNEISSNPQSQSNYVVKPVVTRKDLADRGITCFRCGSKNHFTNKCEINWKSLECSNCRTKGHTRDICMGKKQQNGGSRYQNRGRSRSPERPRSQDRRGKSPGRTPGGSRRGSFNTIDVIADDVNAIFQPGNLGTLTNMPVLVSSERSSMNAVANPDTGAPFTIFNEEFCGQLNVKIDPDLGGLKLASCTQNKIDLLGHVTVKIRFEGHMIESRCLISRNMPGKFLICRADLIGLHVLGPNFPFAGMHDGCASCCARAQPKEISAVSIATEEISEGGGAQHSAVLEE